MDDLSNRVFVAGVILILVGMAGVFSTGNVPTKWRRLLGRIGAACLMAGVACGAVAFVVAG